jgi:hypothetical protein
VSLRLTATVCLAVSVNCVNPQYSCGFARLLLPCYGLKALEKQPLGHRTGNQAIDRNVRHLADGDAGDHHLDPTLLAEPMTVGVIGAVMAANTEARRPTPVGGSTESSLIGSNHGIAPKQRLHDKQSVSS